MLLEVARSGQSIGPLPVAPRWGWAIGYPMRLLRPKGHAARSIARISDSRDVEAGARTTSARADEGVVSVMPRTFHGSGNAPVLRR